MNQKAQKTPKPKKPKRASGEGTLRQRSSGIWELTIMDGFKEDGSRRYKTFYGKTQREAIEKRKAYQVDKGNGLNFETDYAFGEWADIWFDSHKNLISATTQESYRYTLRILNRFFETKKIRTIKAFDVERMLRTLQQEGRSASGLAQCRGMMYQIMNKAEANDLILKNPVRYAEKMRHTGQRAEKEAFSAEEVTALMSMLPKDKIGLSIRLMLATGMRMQEILALEPRNIEPDGSAINVEQAVKMVRGTVAIGSPKSRDSFRRIPVPKSLRYCAVALRDTKDKYIWESKRIPGQPVNPSHFADQFKKALEAVPGVRRLTPHCCRHTYVSQMQALGVDLATIQSIVGHADIDMTKHYLHVQREVQEEAIERFSKAFSGAENADGEVI